MSYKTHKIMAPALIGPPSLTTEPEPKTGDSFIDRMITSLNETTLSPPPQMGLTENFSPTFLTTGNPCLDFFFHVVPNTDVESLNQRLTLAWAHNPLTTLKLICNLRGVRGTGKSDKTGFYNAAFWLHKHHPKTLACNLNSFAEFGYFKDFPEILYRILGLTHPKKEPASIRVGLRRGRLFKRAGKNPKPKVVKNALSDEEKKIAAAEKRKENKILMAKNAVERYNLDPDYRFLLERVSDLFAGYLRADLEALNAGEFNKISLAAKWTPSLDSCYDRATLLCEAIARKVFPRENHVEYSGVEEVHYAYRVRDRLRKEVLVPLRKKLELPEVYMSAKRWGELPYNRVASVAMKTYKELFSKHDGERFKGYLEDVKAGKAKIAAGALLPHEIIASLNHSKYGYCYSDDDNEEKDDSGDEVAELQWSRMVDDMRKIGTMSNCLAVCDVSGSMNGTPMEVCVALGLLLSELSEDPWKGKVITFSADPLLHLITGESLRLKVGFIRRMDWGMNTDFQKVFDLILKVAVQGKLAKESMIKRVFVFSDMEFDQASAGKDWETDYMVIRRKFEEAGYGEVVPEIVFWNLRESRATPVTKDQKGVALVSGFSKNMMKLFLDGKEDQLSPEAVMEAAIAGEEYSKLVVLD